MSRICYSVHMDTFATVILIPFAPGLNCLIASLSTEQNDPILLLTDAFMKKRKRERLVVKKAPQAPILMMRFTTASASQCHSLKGKLQNSFLVPRLFVERKSLSLTLVSLFFSFTAILFPSSFPMFDFCVCDSTDCSRIDSKKQR